jgi:hypothetical protein
MRTIYFDMDGTLANLYAVENWLHSLRTFDSTPYKIAEVMHNMSALARLLHRVQRLGYQIGIISWLSMDSTTEYDEQVTQAKLEWLKLHLPSVKWDIIKITPYGIPKESLRENINDILFDDNVQIREDWGCEAYSPNEILSTLRALT